MIIRYLIYYIYIYYNYIEFLIFLLALRALWTAPITLWSSPKSVVSLRSLCGLSPKSVVSLRTLALTAKIWWSNSEFMSLGATWITKKFPPPPTYNIFLVSDSLRHIIYISSLHILHSSHRPINLNFTFKFNIKVYLETKV